MDWNGARRARRALVLAAGLAALGACGGDAGSESPAPPAAAVEDDADSPVGGPIDRARDVVDGLNRREERIGQQSGG